MFLFALAIASLPAFALSPFDDLSAEEIKQVVKIVRESKRFADDLRYPVVRKADPKKADWLAGRVKDFRHAYAAVYDIHKSVLSEIEIDLRSNQILSVRDLPGIQPPVLMEEYTRAREIIRADAGWQNAMKKRGFTNLEDLFIDPWAPGLLRGDEKRGGQRLIRGLTYVKGAGKNFYSRPVEGVVATVDLAKKKVVALWDVEKAPAAKGIRELGVSAQPAVDPALPPLEITMPKGVGYQINGQEVTWGRWKFRYSMDPMQGLQLYHVRFRDGDVDRSVIYKLNLAEMLVPYGDAAKSWSFRNAFDVGEYGLGKTLHPMVAKQDVPVYATLLDTPVSDDLGAEPTVMKGMAIYERDAGLLWKHRNSENGDVDIRHARELVITFMTTVGNYDYGINYVFKLDGTLQVDTQLTGILLAKGTPDVENKCDKVCKTLVEGNVLAPPHQHFFNFRIDFDVDGPANSVAEVDVKALPSPDSNAFGPVNTQIKHEKEGVRSLNLATARKWKVYNEASRNARNHPRGYALVPGETAVPYLAPTNQIRTRARFVDHPVWFTAYKDDEMSGAHPFPTTAPPGAGLPRYIADDESLENRDVVMWYTFGVTHIPHPEEWPVMNAHHTGFSLVPVNFFSQNPGMWVAE